MSANSFRFNSRKEADKVEDWQIETKKVFDVIELLTRLKVKYETYMLIGDAKSWW